MTHQLITNLFSVCIISGVSPFIEIEWLESWTHCKCVQPRRHLAVIAKHPVVHHRRAVQIKVNNIANRKIQITKKIHQQLKVFLY